MNIVKINNMNPDARDNTRDGANKKINKLRPDEVEKSSFADIYDVKRSSFDNNRQASQWRFRDMLEVNKELNNVVTDMKSVNANEILKPIATEDLLKLTTLLRN